MPIPKRILIVRTDRLGDAVISTPVIENLRLAFPKAKIAFMCSPYTKEVFEGNPFLDKVIVFDKHFTHKGFLGTLKIAGRLRKQKFDWAVILHPANRVHIVTFLSGIPFRLGWDRKLSFLLTSTIKHTKHEGAKHELDYTLDFLRELNITVKTRETLFPVSLPARKWLDRFLSENLKFFRKGYIVMHPWASCPSKRWPLENFLRLIDIIREKTDIPFILTASEKEDSPIYGRFLEREGVFDLRGALSVSRLGALLERAAVFVSNDSGPVHIADSLKIPVMVIFGRRDPGLSPKRWGPLGNKSLVFHKDPGCPRCLAHNCLIGFRCLQAVTPPEVAIEVFRALGL